MRATRTDNDVYGHVNNSIYHHFFDSIVNTYLATHCGHSPTSSPTVGLVVHSHCDYFAPVAFPAVLDICMRVRKLGQSSVTYETAVFERGSEDVKAVGELVHVFVERMERKALAEGMEVSVRRGLEKLTEGAQKAKL